MQVISALSKIKELQGITRSEEDSTEKDPSTEESNTSDFATFLRGVLQPDSANNVSEEELFAGLIGERLKKLKGDDVSNQYTQLLSTQKELTRSASGHVPTEDAAKNALKSLRDSGVITSEEADKIYSESFSAAQLDSDASALFDGRGEANDPTIAVQQMDAALISAQLMIDKFDAGDASADIRSVDEASNSKPSFSAPSPTSSHGDFHPGSISLTPEEMEGLDELSDNNSPSTNNPNSSNNNSPNMALELSLRPSGNYFDGSNGFLFKPISENQRTLAVLLPESLAHKVTKLIVKDSQGNVVEEGQSTGYGELGTREKFSFSKQGQYYPSNLTVEATLFDGSKREFFIPDPSQRYD